MIRLGRIIVILGDKSANSCDSIVGVSVGVEEGCVVFGSIYEEHSAAGLPVHQSPSLSRTSVTARARIKHREHLPGLGTIRPTRITPSFCFPRLSSSFLNKKKKKKCHSKMRSWCLICVIKQSRLLHSNQFANFYFPLFLASPN